MSFNPDAAEWVPGGSFTPAAAAEPEPEAAPAPAAEEPAQEEAAAAPAEEPATTTETEEPSTTNADDAESAPAATDDDNNADDGEAGPAEDEVTETEEEDDEEDDDVDGETVADISELKKHMNIVFIGHVDAGKSTISGHIMVLQGRVSQRAQEQMARAAAAANRETWSFAYALDTTEQERAKGKTEECGRASFSTENKRFTILDAPGHKSFIPHMIGGAAQADVGVLVISARKGEYETGFERGGQTREHAMLAKTSGVRQLIVVINKMDDPTVEWSKERYDECVEGLTPYLKGVGYSPKRDLTFLPISGFTGANLKEPVDPEVCPWYDGPPLLTILDQLQPPQQLLDVPLRLPIADKYRDMGVVVMGKLESGTVSKGEELLLMPNGLPVIVQQILVEEKYEIERAEPGDNLRIKLKGVNEDDVKPGYVLSDPNDVVSAVTVFDAQLIITEAISIITAGYSAILHIHSCQEECVIEKIHALVDKRTGEVLKKKPRFAQTGDTIKCRFRVQEPICIEPFAKFQQLGRFMLRDEGLTIGVGVVLKLKKDKDKAGDSNNA